MTLYQMMVAGGWGEGFTCAVSMASLFLGFFVGKSSRNGGRH